MSINPEVEALNEPLVPEIENELQKRAELIVRKALKNTWLPLRNRGVQHRFMPGLWMETVNILINCLDVEDIINLLTNRSHKLPLVGENDDADPISMPPSHVAKYAKDVTLAAQTIDECLNEAITTLEAEELDDRLPEAVLDSAIFLLINGWGPTHLKRAILEQVAALLVGTVTPILFMEPSRMVELAHPEEKHEPEISEEETIAPNEIEEPVLEEVKRDVKSIRAFIDYSLDEGKAPWVAVIQKTSSEGLEELHLLQGSESDFNGRVAPIRAAIEIMRAIQHENRGSHLLLETTNAFSIRGMEGTKQEKEALRHESEKELWQEFDTLAKEKKITYRTSTRNLSDHIQQIADLAMRCGISNII